MYQALVEFNLFAPGGLRTQPFEVRLWYFEEFWSNSDYPKFGEEVRLISTGLHQPHSAGSYRLEIFL